MERAHSISSYRRLLAISGGVYLIWWFAVELILPNAFNPLGSRLAVVFTIFAFAAATYFLEPARRHVVQLFYAGVWLITLHYFYLMDGNAADFNWVVGAYITVMAINLGFVSSASLLTYSAFVLALSALLVWRHVELQSSVFLPGLLTILLQANVGLRNRLRLVKTLELSNHRFQLLFNSTFEGVLVHEDHHITNANQAMARILGYSQNELIGKNIFDFIHSSDRVRVIDRLSAGDLPPTEIKALRKDGSYVEIEARGRNIRDNKRVSRMVTALDLTDRKRAESERIGALTLMENVRVRDEFISLASHELKTPITALKMQAQLMERDLRKEGGSAKILDYVSRFHRQVDRLTELISMLLDASQIAAGRLVLEKHDVELGELVRQVVMALPAQINDSQVTVHASAKVNVNCDGSRLRQVIENLLSNAIKYGEGRPIEIRVEAEVGKKKIVIQDKGLGIAPEDISRIFDRFERAIPARNISGLGLGLYISRQIVEAHEGTITVSSRLGEGSTFTVTLP